MRPCRDPKILRASSTATDAMETELEPIAVSVRTLLGGGESGLQKMLELAGDCSGGARGGKSFFDLTENLRLADDHRVQARGDAEEMADGLLIAVLVDVRREKGLVQAEVVMQETA